MRELFFIGCMATILCLTAMYDRKQRDEESEMVATATDHDTESKFLPSVMLFKPPITPSSVPHEPSLYANSPEDQKAIPSQFARKGRFIGDRAHVVWSGKAWMQVLEKWELDKMKEQGK